MFVSHRILKGTPMTDRREYENHRENRVKAIPAFVLIFLSDAPGATLIRFDNKFTINFNQTMENRTVVANEKGNMMVCESFLSS